MTANNHAGAIRRAIREEDRRVRQMFPWLRFQSAIGVALVVTAYAAAATAGWLYLDGMLPAWACVIINAIAFSVLREIEHDTIHDLYFKGRRSWQNALLFAIWPGLGNVPSPLYRRKIHLQHHRSSGHEDDLEERLLGNGTSFGPLRWLTMIDPALAAPFRRQEMMSIPGYNRWELIRSMMPVNLIYYALFFGFFICHALSIESMLPFMNAAAVCWVAPNWLRQAVVQTLSSTMHYYGDIEDAIQETQVLSKWYWAPMQWLSCNFGKSHAIHHFVANQPFYLREIVRPVAHRVMREHGVRFDDLGTFSRANRWN